MSISPLNRLVRAVASLAAVALSGCAALGDRATDSVDGRRVEYALVRHGAPAVVFEHGLVMTMNTWADVFPDIAADTTAFAYNRPGYGDSEATATPRDGMHVVEELRATLKGKGIAPPYLLVGHSLGGLYMQYFARRYPEEVAGLVLVDSTHPEQQKGKGAVENWPLWARLVFGAVASPVAKAELAAVDATGKAVLALPAPRQMPIVILSARDAFAGTSEIAQDAHEKRMDMVRLYPGAKQVWVESGHDIPRERPEAVVAAIRELLARTAPPAR